MHGGTVEAHSDGPGRGSEFVVRLPVTEDQASTSSEENTDGDGFPATYRILVVDDNHDAARLLSMTLRLLGNEVHTAYSGREAIDVAARVRPHVVVMDIGMPEMSGYDAARRMRSEPWGKDAILIALTGWGQTEDKQRSAEAGFDHHLVKPLEPATLRRVLESGRDRSPSVR